MEAKSYQQMRKEFQDAYYKKIVPKLKLLEIERKKILRKNRIISITLLIFSILASLLVAFGFISPSHIYSEAILLPFFSFLSVAITFISCLYHYSKKEFENKLKEKIMPAVCECFSDLLWYEGMYLDDKLFFSSNLMREVGICHYDDIFEGSYKGINFEIIETRLSCSSGDGFYGVIIKLDMNKTFKGNTVIYPASVKNNFKLPKDLKSIHLEDINFTRKFDVFGDDEVEVRYLITPSFMERLNMIKVAFLAQSFSCAFYDKYLFIAIPTKDLFSLGSLGKPADDCKQIFTLYEEIISIIKLIDHFKLDQKIGL